MALAFTLEDLTNKLISWRDEASKNPERLDRLKNQIGHDLRSPTNYILGFSTLLSNLPDLTNSQTNLLADFSNEINNYLLSLDLINSYVSKIVISETEKDDSIPMCELGSNLKKHIRRRVLKVKTIPGKISFMSINPKHGANKYFSAMEILSKRTPFLTNMVREGTVDKEKVDYSILIDAGLKQIIYSGNKLFSPKLDSYRLDLDTTFYIHENNRYFLSKDIHVLSEMDSITLQKDYVGEVFSYILNNTVDHAFDFDSDDELRTDSRLVMIKGTEIENYYLVTIQDNGCGIDTKLFPNPSDIFGYKKSRRADRGEHHGKGLYLVKEFIDEIGGEISVENNPENKGAKFTMKLPLR